jgi:hypothetical protein
VRHTQASIVSLYTVDSITFLAPNLNEPTNGSHSRSGNRYDRVIDNKWKKQNIRMKKC